MGGHLGDAARVLTEGGPDGSLRCRHGTRKLDPGLPVLYASGKRPDPRIGGLGIESDQRSTSTVSGSRPGQVTRLLEAWGAGDSGALNALMPLVYGELRSIAAGQLRRERPDHTLQPTALVHEAFLRLIGQDRVQWQSRSHFLGVAAQAMRRVLVDHARRRRAHKRGADPRRVSMEETDLALAPDVDLLELDDCLARLQALDSRQARVVELRVFAGCTMEEIAEALGISESTAKRHWRLARVWLRAALTRKDQ